MICTRPTLLTLEWATGQALISNPGIMAQQWIKSNFSRRQQLNVTGSPKKTVKPGVPKGSMLGPFIS